MEGPSTGGAAGGLAGWARRTVGDLRAAVATGEVAKTELQLFGLDWSQVEEEPDEAPLGEVFARHGAVLDAAELGPEATGGVGKALS